MLVLSLLAEDTLHLLAALASTGGDSLSLSALWIFLFRSWNMSWWRFRVCIIFYTGTLHVMYKVNSTGDHHSYFKNKCMQKCCVWSLNSSVGIKETKNYLKVKLCIAWFSSLEGDETERLKMCLDIVCFLSSKCFSAVFTAYVNMR